MIPLISSQVTFYQQFYGYQFRQIEAFHARFIDFKQTISPPSSSKVRVPDTVFKSQSKRKLLQPGQRVYQEAKTVNMSYTFKALRLVRLQYKHIREQQSQYMIPIQYVYNPYGLYLHFPSFVPYFFNQEIGQWKSQATLYNTSINSDQKIEGANTSNSDGILSQGFHLSTIKIEEKAAMEQGVIRKLKKSNFKSSEDKTCLILKEKKQKQQRQIDGRNANSNLLRMFFRRLEYVLQKTPQLIDRIISKNKMKITKSKFIEWFQINKAEYTNYIRLSCVKKMFVCNRVNRSGKFQTKIMRILLNDFLRKEAHCFYLTSKKIKRAAIGHNYQSIRSILRQIMEEQNDL